MLDIELETFPILSELSELSELELSKTHSRQEANVPSINSGEVFGVRVVDSSTNL
jgi:hypothetical protein